MDPSIDRYCGWLIFVALVLLCGSETTVVAERSTRKGSSALPKWTVGPTHFSHTPLECVALYPTWDFGSAEGLGNNKMEKSEPTGDVARSLLRVYVHYSVHVADLSANLAETLLAHFSPPLNHHYHSDPLRTPPSTPTITGLCLGFTRFSLDGDKAVFSGSIGPYSHLVTVSTEDPNANRVNGTTTFLSMTYLKALYRKIERIASLGLYATKPNARSSSATQSARTVDSHSRVRDRMFSWILFLDADAEVLPGYNHFIEQTVAPYESASFSQRSRTGQSLPPSTSSPRRKQVIPKGSGVTAPVCPEGPPQVGCEPQHSRVGLIAQQEIDNENETLINIGVFMFRAVEHVPAPTVAQRQSLQEGDNPGRCALLSTHAYFQCVASQASATCCRRKRPRNIVRFARSIFDQNAMNTALVKHPDVSQFFDPEAVPSFIRNPDPSKLQIYHAVNAGYNKRAALRRTLDLVRSHHHNKSSSSSQFPRDRDIVEGCFLIPLQTSPVAARTDNEQERVFQQLAQHCILRSTSASIARIRTIAAQLVGLANWSALPVLSSVLPTALQTDESSLFVDSGVASKEQTNRGDCVGLCNIDRLVMLQLGAFVIFVCTTYVVLRQRKPRSKGGLSELTT